MPVARIAAVRSAGVRLVSPMTRPGSRPRASGGAWSTDARRPGAQPLGRRGHRAGRRERPPVGRSPTGSRPGRRPGSVGPSRPRTRTVARHAGPAIAGSPVSSTGALVLAPDAARVEHVDRRLAQHHRPVAAPGQHDRVAGHHRDGGDGRPVGREATRRRRAPAGRRARRRRPGARRRAPRAAQQPERTAPSQCRRRGDAGRDASGHRARHGPAHPGSEAGGTAADATARWPPQAPEPQGGRRRRPRPAPPARAAAGRSPTSHAGSAAAAARARRRPSRLTASPAG